MADRTTSTEETLRPVWIRTVVVLLAVAVTISGAVALGDTLSFDTLRENRHALIAFREAHFTQLALAFVVIYASIVAFSLPGAAVASVTGGFLFGLGVGVVLNVTAATAGAVLIFGAARWGLGDWLSHRIASSEGRLKSLKAQLGENEISVLLLLRLIPAVPFFVANLVPALVGVRFWNFAWTTAVGIIPGAIVFTWIGVGVGDVFDKGGHPDLSLIWEPYVIGPLLGLAALAALPILLRALRRARDA